MTQYHAARSLGGRVSALSWGSSVADFQKLTTVAGVNVQDEMEKISDKTGEYLKRRAEARTPIKTGKGRSSWAKATRGKGGKRQVDVFNTARTKKGLYYLNFVERGTIRIAPRRFFAKAQAEARVYNQKKLNQLNKTISRRFNRGSFA